MIADAYITRYGVFEYLNADGSSRFELRLPEEVAKSLPTFEGVPVTDDHPGVKVDTVNARTFARGTVGESVKMDGDKVAATLMIHDADLIAKIDAGKVEISCGYDVDVEVRSGVWQGIKYDGIQRNIRGNHVAVVDAGRAGPECRMRLDAAECVRVLEPSAASAHVTAGGAGTRIDHMDFEKLYKEAEQRAAAEKARADAEKARADKAEAERDAEKAAVAAEKKRADDAEKARTDAATALPARVTARVALLAAAGRVLHTDGKPDDLTGKSDREIKVAFVERVDGVKIDASRSDDYVDAYFESANKRAAAGAASVAAARAVIVENRGDAGKPAAPAEDPDIEVAAMNRMNQDSRNRGRSDRDPAVKAAIQGSN